MGTTTPEKETLTPRELQVLILMASSYHNKEIAIILNITDHTIKFHVNNIMTKTKQTTRLGATIVCLKAGIITLESLIVYTPNLPVAPMPEPEPELPEV